MASFTASPNRSRSGQSDASTPRRRIADGTITNYKWDLKGSGKYETNTGSTPRTTSFSDRRHLHGRPAGHRQRRRRSSTATEQISVGSFPPVAHVSAIADARRHRPDGDAERGESSDQGSITDYKWDLEGSGNYETNTGSTPTMSNSFQNPSIHTVGVR